MASRFEVPADKLAWRCDLSFLPFSCTADMTPLEDFIGQERAMRAIQFGLGVTSRDSIFSLPDSLEQVKPASSRLF